MTSTDITKNLHSHFRNYDYRLTNSFVFNWESDFFCRSKSGYVVECEVKISRGDFLRDFAKPKHLIFQDLAAKKKYHITRSPGRWHNDNLIGYQWVVQLVTQYGEFYEEKKPKQKDTFGRTRYNQASQDLTMRSRHWGWKSVRMPNGEWGFLVNDWGNIDLVQSHRKELRAPCTDIRIKELEKMLYPNQFYFAVPEGLITKEEVPAYAGLLSIPLHEGKPYANISVIKKAPYLHKRYMDLTSILLKKYYNLWTYKVPWEVKQKIMADYSEEPPTTP